MFNFKTEFYLKIIFLFSFIALISAFFIEYVLGHQPCNLCLIERIPYGLSMMIIMVIFLIQKNQKFLVLLLILTFIFSFAISFYHYGIEQGFFKESTVCGVKNLTESITKEDLLKQFNEKIISCRDVTFRIFGLSLTSINIVISLLFIITLLKIFERYEKNK
tara:strand:+ start:502 stop:987 length:486 start_codon:yes stop_codon:yes gene_type:complete